MTSHMTRPTTALLGLLFASSLVAQSQRQQPVPPPAPNQVALAEAREHAKAGRAAEAIAALERVTPPAPAVLNQLRTSDEMCGERERPIGVAKRVDVA